MDGDRFEEDVDFLWTSLKFDSETTCMLGCRAYLR